MLKMYEVPEAYRTLDERYMTEYLRQTQRTELRELITVITKISKRKGSPIDVFDIGVGNARIPIILAGNKEIWKCIGKYVGIDISNVCLRAAKNNVLLYKLSDKVIIKNFDARNLSQLVISSKKKYDLVICTILLQVTLYLIHFPLMEKLIT